MFAIIFINILEVETLKIQETKEILNKYTIENEVRNELISRVNWMAFFSVLVIGLTIFVWFLMAQGSNSSIVFLAFVLICVYVLYQLCLNIYRLCVFRSKYKVVKDTLANVSWSVKYRRGVYLKLDFYNYGPYFIGKHKTLYACSNISEIDASRFKDKCLPGDEFYLVKLGKEIICLYNLNDFELDSTQINL